MSEWAYVRGTLMFNSSPFETKKDGTVYLPYPEEQFKLGAPIVGFMPDKTKEKIVNSLGYESYPEKHCIKFDGSCVYSLPRAKKYIKKAFKLFPQGESGFRYVLDQQQVDARSSAGGFLHECMYDYYHKAIDKLYSTFPTKYGVGWNFDDLNSYIGVKEDCSYSMACDIICGINASLRSATADEVYESLIKFINYLVKHKITIGNSYLEWTDSFSSYDGYRYAFRTGTWCGEWTIMKLDLKTNEIIWKHSHVHPTTKTKDDKEKLDSSKFIDVEETITRKD